MRDIPNVMSWEESAKIESRQCITVTIVTATFAHNDVVVVVVFILSAATLRSRQIDVNAEI